jgi:hypothetical protein
MNDTEKNQETQLAVTDNSKFITQNNWDLAAKVAQLCRAFVAATAVSIAGKRYIPVEGWQSIAAAWGYTPSTEEPYRTPNGYRCKAQLKRDSDGMVISEAYGYVGEDEIWKDRAQYANEAMVQTRAISRVCRNKFAFVAVLMKIPNLATTPAEEVPRDVFGNEKKTAVDPKEHTYQGVIEKVWDYAPKPEDKDKRQWYNAKIALGRIWTRKPEVGEMLIEANGLDVKLRLLAGSKPDVFQVMDVQPAPSAETQAAVEQEPDDIML